MFSPLLCIPFPRRGMLLSLSRDLLPFPLSSWSTSTPFRSPSPRVPPSAFSFNPLRRPHGIPRDFELCYSFSLPPLFARRRAEHCFLVSSCLLGQYDNRYSRIRAYPRGVVSERRAIADSLSGAPTPRYRIGFVGSPLTLVHHRETFNIVMYESHTTGGSSFKGNDKVNLMWVLYTFAKTNSF